MPQERVNVVTRAGRTISLPQEEAEQKIAQGLVVPESERAEQQRGIQEAAEISHGGGANAVQAVGLGALDALTFSGSTRLLPHVPGFEDTKDVARQNPGEFFGGQLAGTAVGLGATGSGQVARALQFTPGGQAFKLADKAGRSVLGQAPGTLRRSAAFAVEGAIEGQLYGAGQAFTQAALSDEPITVEKLAASSTAGGLLGFGLGGTLGALGGVTRKAARKFAADANPLLVNSPERRAFVSGWNAELRAVDREAFELVRKARVRGPDDGIPAAVPEAVSQPKEKVWNVDEALGVEPGAPLAEVQAAARRYQKDLADLEEARAAFKKDILGGADEAQAGKKAGEVDKTGAQSPRAKRGKQETPVTGLERPAPLGPPAGELETIGTIPPLQLKGRVKTLADEIKARQATGGEVPAPRRNLTDEIAARDGVSGDDAREAAAAARDAEGIDEIAAVRRDVDADEAEFEADVGDRFAAKQASYQHRWKGVLTDEDYAELMADYGKRAIGAAKAARGDAKAVRARNAARRADEFDGPSGRMEDQGAEALERIGRRQQKNAKGRLKEKRWVPARILRAAEAVGWVPRKLRDPGVSERVMKAAAKRVRQAERAGRDQVEKLYSEAQAARAANTPDSAAVPTPVQSSATDDLLWPGPIRRIDEPPLLPPGQPTQAATIPIAGRGDDVATLPMQGRGMEIPLEAAKGYAAARKALFQRIGKVKPGARGRVGKNVLDGEVISKLTPDEMLEVAALWDDYGRALGRLSPELGQRFGSGVLDRVVSGLPRNVREAADRVRSLDDLALADLVGVKQLPPGLSQSSKALLGIYGMGRNGQLGARLATKKALGMSDAVEVLAFGLVSPQAGLFRLAWKMGRIGERVKITAAKILGSHKVRAAGNRAMDARGFVPAAAGSALAKITWGDSKHKDPIRARMEELSAAMANLSATRARLEDGTAHIAALNPSLSEQLIDQTMFKLEHYYEHMPKDPMGANPLVKSLWQPTALESAEWAERVTAGEFPEMFLDQLAKGGPVSAAAIETVQTLYPELWTELQSTVIEQAMEQGEVPYEKRLLLAQVFDIPAEPSLQSVGFIQEMYALAAQPPGPATPQAGQLDNPIEPTKGQRLSNR